MPEGHTIRHLATTLSYGFVGTSVEAESPQGRFKEEALRVNGQRMTETSAHGKHLFLHFGDDIVHVHLGLYGWFNLRKNKEQKAKDSVRLRLKNEEYIADLVGPTACELFTHDDVAKKVSKLGPDPLKSDADPEIAWKKIKKSSKTIGALLMDQSVIAGIGNVYRAELLFLAKLSPFLPGKEVSDKYLDKIWKDAVRLLHIGAQDGFIRTVKEEHLTMGEELQKYRSENSYVYKRTGQLCRLCNDIIESTDLAGRTVYWCPSCQN